LIIALEGGLGSGKTCLAKGIASGLGICETLTSPTYTIINEYKIEEKYLTLYHVDAYRLNDNDEFDKIGGSELINNGISIIEWSEKIKKSLPENIIKINLEITGEKSRIIKIDGLTL
jgi:tRNA threonylcarbamoyladenosine biosynthesis protein TsaE